jgi:hypothetical protein
MGQVASWHEPLLKPATQDDAKEKRRSHLKFAVETFVKEHCVVESGAYVSAVEMQAALCVFHFFRVDREAVDGMREHLKTKMDIMSHLEFSMHYHLHVAVKAHNDVLNWISHHVNEINKFNVDTNEAAITIPR